MRLREGRLLRPGDLTAPSRAILVNTSFAKTYFTDGRPAGRPSLFGPVSPVARCGHRRGGGRCRRRHAAGRSRRPAAGADLRGAGRESADWASHAGGEDRRRSGRSGAPRSERRRPLAPGATVERMGPLASKISGSRRRPTLHDGCAHVVRDVGAGARRDGTRRRAVVRHRAAPPGARRAHGARRDARRRRPHDPPRRPAATGVGLAAGMLLAACLTRAMASALFGVTPLDPVAFSAAPCCSCRRLRRLPDSRSPRGGGRIPSTPSEPTDECGEPQAADATRRNANAFSERACPAKLRR